MKRIIRVLSMMILLFALTAGIASAQTHRTSHRKKDAIIGGGTGVIGGALISKHHRVKHAVIGGVIGTGTGYVIGKHKDKKIARRHRYYHHH